MLGKRSRPTIGKLAGVLRSGIIDTITSPRSPLDCRVLRTPTRLKSYYCDQQGGVGLGIIVALDNTSSNNNCNVVCGGEILAKYAICTHIPTRSLPIKVGPPSKHKNCDKSIKKEENYNMMEGFEEEFTYVTCHAPNKSTTTRVYYGGCEYEPLAPKLSKKLGVFNISSPARFSDDHHHHHRSDSDFLSSCHLCRKCLNGKDIYMYRGEKAFCSEECRQRQIGIDERKEQCRSEASRSTTDISSSPYSEIFHTGIVAV